MLYPKADLVIPLKYWSKCSADLSLECCGLVTVTLMAEAHQWKQDKLFEEAITTFQTSKPRLWKDIYFQWVFVMYNLMSFYGFGPRIHLSRIASLQFHSMVIINFFFLCCSQQTNFSVKRVLEFGFVC